MGRPFLELQEAITPVGFLVDGGDGGGAICTDTTIACPPNLPDSIPRSG